MSWEGMASNACTRNGRTGAGDMTAALFLGHLLLHESPAVALEKMAGSVYGIFEKTFNTHSRELQIIPAQEEIVVPTHVFDAKKIV